MLLFHASLFFGAHPRALHKCIAVHTRMSATAPVVKEVPEETQIAELKCTLADLKANAKDSGESLQVCATHRYFMRGMEIVWGLAARPVHTFARATY